MRPKVVILILLAAFAVLGGIAVLKGVVKKPASDSSTQASTTGGSAGANAQTTNAPLAAPGVNNGAPVPDDLREAIVSREMDKIQELQGEIDGSNNPVIIDGLIQEATYPDPDVRKAAVEAIREINDTNAIPKLQKLADGIQDAREKVSVLDVIDYLALPNIMPDVQPTNLDTNVFRPLKIPQERMNQQFMKEYNKQRHNQQPAAQDGAAAPQPQ